MPVPAPSPLAGPRLWDRSARDYLRDVAPGLTLFCEDALRLARVERGSRLADVACGPGGLALAAARRGAQVAALDFSAEMIGLLRAQAAREGVGGVDAAVGDGQALPWPDGGFDAAASLFGLIFFPDRARGLAELHRILRPGGRAVIASWVPAERVPILAEAWQVLGAALPEFPYSRLRPVLGSPDEVRAELSGAGFGGIEVHELRHDLAMPSAAEYWRSLERSTPPMLAARATVSPARWAGLSAEITALVDARHGTGPFRVELVALLGMGVRPGA
jgi:SAM-dependent methyltransferase